jgi:hypothetical protein
MSLSFSKRNGQKSRTNLHGNKHHMKIKNDNPQYHSSINLIFGTMNIPMLLWKYCYSYFCWHGIWPDGLCGVRPKAAGMRWLAAPIGRHQPPCRGVGFAPAVILGIDLRIWYSAKPSMPASFPYIFPGLCLSLLFKQMLLNDSELNISIRTW